LLRFATAGTLLLYDSSQMAKGVRQDEIAWQTKKKGTGVREDHLKLKVNHKPMLYACYAHCATIQVRVLCCGACAPLQTGSTRRATLCSVLQHLCPDIPSQALPVLGRQEHHRAGTLSR